MIRAAVVYGADVAALSHTTAVATWGLPTPRPITRLETSIIDSWPLVDGHAKRTGGWSARRVLSEIRLSRS